jgi:hypothetical protein
MSRPTQMFLAGIGIFLALYFAATGFVTAIQALVQS